MSKLPPFDEVEGVTQPQSPQHEQQTEDGYLSFSCTKIREMVSDSGRKIKSLIFLQCVPSGAQLCHVLPNHFLSGVGSPLAAEIPACCLWLPAWVQGRRAESLWREDEMNQELLADTLCLNAILSPSFANLTYCQAFLSSQCTIHQLLSLV